MIYKSAPLHVVIFHAGANIAQRWSDFQSYSQSDQDYFDQLLPIECIDPRDHEREREIEPISRNIDFTLEVKGQSEVLLEEIPLIQEDETCNALLLLQQQGYTLEDINTIYKVLQPVPTTKARERQAKRSSLDIRTRTEAARILKERGINPSGKELDKQHLGRYNWVVVKAAIDQKINNTVGRSSGQRHDFSRSELDQIDIEFNSIIAEVVQEIFGVTN